MTTELPLEIKEKINFINAKYDQLNIESVNSKIIQNIEELFHFLSLNSKSEIYLSFLLELKNRILDYINDYKRYLQKKKFYQTKNTNIDNKYLIGKLENKITEKIIKISNKKINLLEKNALCKKLERSDLTINGGIFVLRLIKIINKELKKNGYLKIISDYLKQDTEVTGLALELSSEHSTWWKHKDINRPEPKTLYAHLDKELKNIKAIIYLSNVTEQNGPLTFYPGIYENLKINILQNIIGRVINDFVYTNNNLLKNYYNFQNLSQPFQSKKFKEHFNELPKILQFNSHFGWDIESGSKEETNLLSVEKKIIGELGTFIIFDGAQLIHSGGLVKKDQRIALQLIFGEKQSFIKFFYKKFKNFTKKLTL